jgi:hypothetical protein
MGMELDREIGVIVADPVRYDNGLHTIEMHQRSALPGLGLMLCGYFNGCRSRSGRDRFAAQRVGRREQGTFYVLPTSVLNREVPEQKTIRLGPLQALGPRPNKYNELKAAIYAAAAINRGS